MNLLARHRRIVVAAAPIAVIALVVGLWAFQPWKVFTSQTIDEELPTVQAGAPSGQAAPSSQPVASSQPAQPAQPAQGQPAPPPQPQVLSESGFVSQEHETGGIAKLVQLEDGSRYLRLEGLSSSDGPDLHVWLTDQVAGSGDWASYDDGRYVRLGKLKATHGNQNYPIPADADLAGLRSVVIWCDRFNVAFGSAALSVNPN